MAYDVFVSYRRADGQELANEIAKQLWEMGFSVYLDTKEMVAGRRFDDQLAKKIRETPNIILLITPKYLEFREKEDWCKEEIKHALEEYDRSPDTRRVLPVYPNSAAYLAQKELMDKDVDRFRKFDSVELIGEAPNENEYRRIAKAISGINPHNIWNSAQRYLENNKRPGRRFGNLHICDAILPCGKATADTDLPINGVLGDQKRPLLEAVKQTNAPLYIIGEGGIGKTTSLIRIMEDAYEGKTYQKESAIPLFVELNLAPSDKNDKCYEGGKSTFIIRQICSILRREKKAGNVSFSDVERMEDEFEKTVIPFIEEDFRKESTNPQYWLLLDGLNEVSQQNPDTYGLIFKEVIFLLKECPNVRVILTDRNDETSLSCARYGITKFYLSGIDRETISAYLHQKEMQTAETLSEEMLDILRIPLFLTMYASLKNAGGVTSRGGLLRRFFHEKSDAFYSEYNQQERLEASGYNSEQMAFILDFIIPAIAWHMEKDGKFSVDRRYCEKIAFSLLPKKLDEKSDQEEWEEPDDSSFIGYYGETAFEKYRSGGRIDVASVAEEIRKLCGGNKKKIIGFILDCAVRALGILFDKNGIYGFVHQHIRDYYAAVYDVDLLRLAVHQYERGKHQLSIESLAPFQETPNGWDKTRFIGEYLGEDGNKPYQKGDRWIYNVPSEPCDRNLIKRALSIYRGRFDGTDGYGLYNLIEVLKLVREDLTGEDFTKLDFTGISLYDVCLGHFNDGSGADFFGAKISDDSMLPFGHCDIVTSIDISPDNTRLLTASSHPAIVKEWDLRTGQCIRSKGPIEDDLVNSIDYPYGKALYSSDGKILFVGKVYATDVMSYYGLERDEVGWNNWVISKFDFGKDEIELQCHSTSYELAKDENFSVFIGSDGVVFVDGINGTEKYLCHKDLTFRPNCIDEEKRKYAFLSDNGNIEEWDIGKDRRLAKIDYYAERIRTNNDKSFQEYEKKDCISLVYSPNGCSLYSQWVYHPYNPNNPYGETMEELIEWESETGKRRFCYPPCNRFIISNDSTVIIFEDENRLNAWNTKTHSKLWSVTTPFSVMNGTFSKDDSLFIAEGYEDNSKSHCIVCAFDTMTGLIVHKIIVGVSSESLDFALFQNDTFLLCTKQDRLEKWNVWDCECTRTKVIRVEDPVGFGDIQIVDDNTAIVWTRKQMYRFNPKTLYVDEMHFFDLTRNSSKEQKNEVIFNVQLKQLENGSIVGLVVTLSRNIIVDIASMETKQVCFVDGGQALFRRSQLGKTGSTVYWMDSEEKPKAIYAWDYLKNQRYTLMDLPVDNGDDYKCIRAWTLSPNEDRVAIAYEFQEAWSLETQGVIKEYDIMTGKCLSAVEFAKSNPRQRLEYLTESELLHDSEKIDLKAGRIVRQEKGGRSIGENKLAHINYMDDEKAEIEIWDLNMETCYQKIPVKDGLIVCGCKFKNLHPDSKIDRDLLKKYGAEV